MENNLLYVITMMLKDEINQLENVNQVDNFLDNTKCSYLLKELQKMPDIQIYFKNVILKTVELIESKYSFKQIKFNVDEILKDLLKYRKEEEKKLGKKNSNKNIDEIYKSIINTKIDLSINYSREESSQTSLKQNEIFIKNYVPDITKEEFINRGEKAKNENKNNLIEYYKTLENDIKSNNNEDLYSNKVIMKKMFNSNLPTYLLSFYLTDFLEVIKFIEQLIQDLMSNILLLPNSIKYICKVISLLIKKKFKNITKAEENAFISKFLIGKLLIPIISFPNFKALISDYVISGNTLKNIKEINYILNKLFSWKLFLNNEKEGDYTPFNWFFMDKIENLFDFYEKAINVNLPNFIEKYINDELPEDYSYDYFNENKEEFIANISICFNPYNLYHLVVGLQKNDNKFQGNNQKYKKLEKILGRIKPENLLNVKCEVENHDEDKIPITTKDSFKNKEKFKNIIEKCKEKQKEKEKQKVCAAENYFLYSEKVIDKKYAKLFSINNKVDNFYIDLKKTEKNKKIDENEKNIIKVKNYLCGSLGNYRLLNKSDFNIESTSDTISLLNEIKSYMALPNFILSNNTIPSIWYINSILDYLNKIPEEYKENDYKKLFSELTQNLNESINSLDFEKLIIFRNKLKFFDKNYNYYEDSRHLINNIIANENIKHIVEDAFIPVDIIFNYDDICKKFELTKSNIKDKLFEDKIIYQDSKKTLYSLKTIEAFTTYFPNLTKYQSLQDINPLDIIKELSINKAINNYFSIIKEKIIKKNLLEINKYENYYEEKLKNYIMNKIYEKIYPPEPDEMDNKIFKKTMSLSWVDPHSIIEKDYILDNLLPDILNEFDKIRKAKTPYKKLECLNNIIIFSSKNCFI